MFSCSRRLILILTHTTKSQTYLTYTRGVLNSSRTIHNLLANSVISSTYRFLDQTPLGRIISRFTQDIRAVDATLASQTLILTMMTSALVLKLCSIVWFTPIYLIPGLLLAGTAYMIGRVYMAAQLSIKR